MSAGVQIRGSRALVTGAGSGIGRATAITLARHGAQVLCVDVNLETAEQTAQGCRIVGADADAYQVDVANREAVESLAKEVAAHHDGIDLLVNNAGVGMSGRFLDTEPDDWDWLLGVNLHGVVNCTYAFGPAMVERRRGHVVNIASGLAYFHRPTEVAYVTSKAAVLALSRTLRLDWRPHGIGVTAICPGIINTPIVRNSRMLGHAARPEAVARAVNIFSKRGHPPERVATAIVRGIERNRAVVPVGLEAWLGWAGHHMLPTAASDGIAALSDGLTAVEPA